MASSTSPHLESVASALHSAAIHLLRGVRKEDAQSGLGPASLSALSVLVFAGPMRLTKLALIEQVKAPTMSKIVAGLEEVGLVKRGSDAEDARAITLRPTARGTRLLQKGRQRRVTRLAQALVTLDASELALLARAAPLIERIARNV